MGPFRRVVFGITVEWPTWLALFCCYAAWVALTLGYHVIGPWLFMPLAAYVVGLHSSLQHEALHGHPTRNRRINEALVFLPIGLFYPYRRFRDTHLAHHRDERLTDPYEDPESWYLAEGDWFAMSAPVRLLRKLNATLLGRLLIGPAIGFVGFVRHDFRLIRAGDKRVAKAWFLHLIGLFMVLGWVQAVAGINPFAYLMLAAYPGASLLMIRTYAEHRAVEEVDGRTAIIESGPVFSLLFLNNNLHAVHHKRPRLPWYRLPRHFREQRELFADQVGVDLVPGYGAIFRQYLLRAREPIVHPFMQRKGSGD